MLLFLTELRDRYGSVQGYLCKAGLDPRHVDALRAHLLRLSPGPATVPGGPAGRAPGARPAGHGFPGHGIR